jgi:hypothetical protein
VIVTHVPPPTGPALGLMPVTDGSETVYENRALALVALLPPTVVTLT